MAEAARVLGDLASFTPHEKLTKVQERVIPSVLNECDNIIVSAPTGSGKTLILEVAILKMFRHRLTTAAKDSGMMHVPDQTNTKAVYVCPIKALAQEKFDHWTTIFPSLLVVIETGDQERERGISANSFTSICRADIIITTPERWDSITRRWKEKNVFEVVNTVSLLLLDEIHTVHEERGAALEAIVSRMKTIKAATERNTQPTRIVAISGTLPNIDDLAAWLGVPPQMTFSFSPEDRPVPLTTRVIPFQNDSNNSFAFDRFLSFKIFNLVREYADGRPTIIFCSTRKQAVSSALHLVQDIREAAAKNGCMSELEPSAEVTAMASKINDRQLRTSALLGIAFHHAALSPDDRRIVERMFRQQFIAVVCTTTTLSMGVNLPAHLVIVKGTTFYNHGATVDMPISEVAQMCGRAGRPGLDDHGIALILTTASKQHIYGGLVTGKATLTTVESQLHLHIIEHVNAEIALRTIHTVSCAMEWAMTTFFWLRLQKNPKYYGLSFASKEDEIKFDHLKYIELLINKAIKALQEAGCATLSNDSNDNSVRIESTSIGRSMSRLYISFGTVTHCNTSVRAKLSATSLHVERFSLSDVLQLLSQCEEFSDIRLRQGDKGVLNNLNKEVKYPLKNGFKGGREVREDWHKVYLLIQAHVMGHHLSDMSLRNDMFRLLSSVQRTGWFLRDYAATTACCSLVIGSELLKRSLEKKVWGDSHLLKQLTGVTDEMTRKLIDGGIQTFSQLSSLAPHKIEALCSKPPPFGSLLLREVTDIPTVDVSLEEFKVPRSSFKLKIFFSSMLHEQNRAGRSSNSALFPEDRCIFQLIVGDSSDHILLVRTVSLAVRSKQAFDFTFSGGSGYPISICLLARDVVGIDHRSVVQHSGSSQNLSSNEKKNETESKTMKKSQEQKETVKFSPTKQSVMQLYLNLRTELKLRLQLGPRSSVPITALSKLRLMELREPKYFTVTLRSTVLEGLVRYGGLKLLQKGLCCRETIMSSLMMCISRSHSHALKLLASDHILTSPSDYPAVQSITVPIEGMTRNMPLQETVITRILFKPHQGIMHLYVINTALLHHRSIRMDILSSNAALILRSPLFLHLFTISHAKGRWILIGGNLNLHLCIRIIGPTRMIPASSSFLGFHLIGY
eukprot:gene13285-9126_t